MNAGATGRLERVEQQIAPRSLRRLGANQAVAIDRRAEHRAVDALERVDDGHDRHRRSVLAAAARRPHRPARADQRSRAVVDEHDVGRRWPRRRHAPNRSAARRRRRPSTSRSQSASAQLVDAVTTRDDDDPVDRLGAAIASTDQRRIGRPAGRVHLVDVGGRRPSARSRRRQRSPRRRTALRDARALSHAAARRPSVRRPSAARARRSRRPRARSSSPPPSTTIIVPSSRYARPWPGSLPCWMTLTLQRVARQERRLDRVGQLVQVEDAHVVELRDAVEVVVVGEDARACGGAPARRASRRPRRRLTGPRRTARPRCAGPSAGRQASRGRAGRARDAPGRGCRRCCCSSATTKRGTTSVPVQEARGDDVGDAAVDQRARVDVGHAGRRAAPCDRRSGTLSRPQLRSGLGEVVPLGDGQAHHPEPGDDDRRRSAASQLYGSGRLAIGRPSRRPITRPTISPADGAHEFARREVDDALDEPARGHER